MSAEAEQLTGATFVAADPTPTPEPEDTVTDDITDVLPDDIPVEDLSKKHLIMLLHFRTDRSVEDIAALVGTQETYVRTVTADLQDTQQPVVAGSLHDCRQHDAVRYLKCVEDGAVFDLEAVDWSGRKPNFGDRTDPLIHSDWFQHNRFEGYVVKPEGCEPPARPAGAVKEHRVQ